jgi:ADP-heptose:LPS heptosyltransferase
MGFGDEIMVTGIARRMQERSSAPVRVLDKHGRPRWSSLWDGNPRLAPPRFRGAVQTLINGPGRRPYIARETERSWVWRDWVCPLGELHLTKHERALAAGLAGRVIVEPGLKAEASPNKDWGWKRWAALSRALLSHGHAVAQVGPAGSPRLPGVELLPTASFREACAVLSVSRLAILPEGGLHHAAAALGTAAIVIFGGYISPRQTGYAHQVSLFTGGRPCGRRDRCSHCAEAMKRIPVDEVVARALTLLRVMADPPCVSEAAAEALTS